MDKNVKPFVSVLMPVYNAEKYLIESVNSILNQSYFNFEFIIINDGSTDKSDTIVLQYADKRIKYIKNESNIGLIKTLNKGIKLAEGKYIIRMDADDISLPTRVEEQVNFMEGNRHIDIAGTWFKFIDNQWVVKHPTNYAACKVKLLENTALGHPTIIMRKESIIKNNLWYASDALHAEDYKMWTDAIIKGLTISNYPKVLLHYRAHEAQISTAFHHIQKKTVIQIQRTFASHFWNKLLYNKEEIYIALINNAITLQTHYTIAKQLVSNILLINEREKKFNQYLLKTLFNEHLSSCARNVYFNAESISYKIWFDKYFYFNTTIREKLGIIKKIFCHKYA